MEMTWTLPTIYETTGKKTRLGRAFSNHDLEPTNLAMSISQISFQENNNDEKMKFINDSRNQH
jgi:hypothetical protein